MTVRCTKFMRPPGANQRLDAETKFQGSTELGIHNTRTNTVAALYRSESNPTQPVLGDVDFQT